MFYASKYRPPAQSDVLAQRDGLDSILVEPANACKKAEQNCTTDDTNMCSYIAIAQALKDPNSLHCESRGLLQLPLLHEHALSCSAPLILADRMESKFILESLND